MTELASNVNTDQVGSLSPVGPDLYFLSDFGLLDEVVVKESRTLTLNRFKYVAHVWLNS